MSACGECADTGFIRVRNEAGHEGLIRCQCVRERAIRQRIAQLPPRLRDSTLRRYVPSDALQRLALDALAQDLTGSFAFEGSYSRGKTHLAVAQYIELVKLERPCLFFNMSELFMELRKAELDPDGYYCDVWQRVRYADKFHLFIDDVDKFRVTEFRFESLYDLINTIYTRRLGLTVTMNFSLLEMRRRELLDGAILRRIEDVCEVVSL